MTTASHHLTTSLSQVSFPSGWHISISTKLNSECVYALSSSVLADVSMPFRMPADEDRATQAQHICHSLPAVDFRNRAHLPRRQQRGEVTDIHSEVFYLKSYFLSLVE